MTTMVERLARQERRSRPSDPELLARAVDLSRRWLAGQARPASVRWSADQRRRWGSCSVDQATIRLSSRLQGMPSWVIDYVLLHELAHLVEASHGPEFWALLEPFPDLARARAFLDGVSWADGHDGQEHDDGAEHHDGPERIEPAEAGPPGPGMQARALAHGGESGSHQPPDAVVRARAAHRRPTRRRRATPHSPSAAAPAAATATHCTSR